jgi:hypothetical protein
VIDQFEFDSISDIARTEGFSVLLAQLRDLAKHYERQVVNAAADEPVEAIRFAAGRANGIRLVVDRLEMAKKKVYDGNP